MRPPALPRTTPPSAAPGKALTTWESLLGKPETLPDAGVTLALSDIPANASATRKFLESASSSTPAYDTIQLADLPTNASATRKFLRSVSSGAAAWDTLVAADVTGDVAAVRKFLRSLGSGASPGATVWDTLTAADIAAGTFVGSFVFSLITINAAAAANGLVLNGGANNFAGKINGSSTAGQSFGLFIAAGTSSATDTALLVRDATGGTNYFRIDGGGNVFPRLPVSAAGLPAGALWNNAGVVNVA